MIQRLVEPLLVHFDPLPAQQNWCSESKQQNGKFFGKQAKIPMTRIRCFEQFTARPQVNNASQCST